MISQHQSSWALEDVLDQTLKKEIIQQYSRTLKAQGALRYCLTLTAFSRTVMVVFGNLPITYQCIMETRWFWINCFAQNAFLVIGYFLLMGLDNIFIGACTISATQFKIANYLLHTMDYKGASVSIFQRTFINKYLYLQR